MTLEQPTWKRQTTRAALALITVAAFATLSGFAAADAGEEYANEATESTALLDAYLHTAADPLYLASGDKSDPAPLHCPSDLNILLTVDVHAAISWEKVEHADAYKIYRADGDSSYKHIATVAANKTNYTDKDIENGTTYSYIVTAVTATIESQGCQENAAEITIDASLLCPSNVVVMTTLDGHAFLMANANLAAETLVIHRATDGAALEVIATVNATVSTFTDEETYAGHSYTYLVSTVDASIVLDLCPTVSISFDDKEKDTKDDKDEDKEKDKECSGPASIEAHTDGPTNVVEWSSFEGADKYNLYRAEGDGPLEHYETTGPGTTAFDDEDVEAGTVYTYQVTATVEGDETEACDEAEITAIPVFPTIVGAVLATTLGVGAYTASQRQG